MNEEQFNKMKLGRGFIAALDQSGGSTPKALMLYGIPEDRTRTTTSVRRSPDADAD